MKQIFSEFLRTGYGRWAAVVEGYKVKINVLSTGDAERTFTALNGLKSMDGDTAITNLIAKLVPEKAGTVFSQSEYMIDLSKTEVTLCIPEQI